MKWFSPLFLALFLLGTPPEEIAQGLLKMQLPNGAIPDAPGWKACNTDSNMEYALLGLAASYWKWGERKYSESLRKGILWLARTEIMEGRFRGAWWYSYDCRSLKPLRRDVVGVDSTSALFIYLAWLYDTLTSEHSLVGRLEPNIKAAFSFLLKSRMGNGFFNNSWVMKEGQYRRINFAYSTDQADVYLGIYAAWRLLKVPAGGVGLWLENNIWRLFNLEKGFFFLGISGDDEPEDINSPWEAFNQGYLAWAFGPNPLTASSLGWLESHQEEDGGIRIFAEEERFTLPAIAYAMGMGRIGIRGEPRVSKALDWVIEKACHKGGIRDTEGKASPCFVNLAGLYLIAWTNFPPFADSRVHHR